MCANSGCGSSSGIWLEVSWGGAGGYPDSLKNYSLCETAHWAVSFAAELARSGHPPAPRTSSSVAELARSTHSASPLGFAFADRPVPTSAASAETALRLKGMRPRAAAGKRRRRTSRACWRRGEERLQHRDIHIARIARAVGIAEFHKRIVDCHLQVFGRHRRGTRPAASHSQGTTGGLLARPRAPHQAPPRWPPHAPARDRGRHLRLTIVRRCSHGGPGLAMGQRVGNVLARRLASASAITAARISSSSRTATHRPWQPRAGRCACPRSEQCSHIRQATL